MSKHHSGQLIRSNALTRQGLILMVPLPAADPVSILQCPLVPSRARSSYNSGEANAGRSPFPHRALSDIMPPVLGAGQAGGPRCNARGRKGVMNEILHNSCQPYFALT